ncbi:MAG: hypothetical protein KAX49_01905 [Halanaerobiales bacterium]|nr:hypothetical protein [Halanaerobiales bacterium]
MSNSEYICESKLIRKKKCIPTKKINILIPIYFSLPCETSSIIEIYDSKIIVEKIKTKMLGTKAVIVGKIKIILHYFSVDNLMHRVAFCIEFIEEMDLNFYYRGVPEVIVKAVYRDFELAEPVSDKCEKLGYKKVIGQLVVKGFIKIPKPVEDPCHY